MLRSIDLSRLTIIVMIAQAVCLHSQVFASTPAERATAQALQNQINTAISNGDSHLTIPAGDYRIGSFANEILTINGASNLTIDMTGVNLIATDLKQVLRINQTNNLSLIGGTIDYDPLPFTQGTITSISGLSFDVDIHDGYKTVTGNQRVIVYDAQTRRVKDNTVTRYGAAVGDIGGGNLRIARLNNSDALAVGDLVSVTGDISIPHAVLLQDSSNILLQNTMLHAATTFGFFENGGGGNTYNNVSVVPGPVPTGGTQPRLLSSNADAFHSKHTSVGPSILNSHFKNQGDDGIAINTDYHLVGSSVGTELQVGAKTTWDQLRFQIGDKIRGYNRTTGNVTEATVLSIVRDASLDAGLTSIRNTHLPASPNSLNTGYRLVLDQPLNVNAGDLISSPDRNGNGFEIRDTTVENHRARGILIKASNGIVENSTVDGSTIGGIVIASEPLYWQEASFAENVIIRGNTVRNTSKQFSSAGGTQGAAIAITIDFGWVGGTHNNIVVENNTVESSAGPGLIVNSADVVQVLNNHFVDTHQFNTNNGTSSGIDPTTVVWVDKVSNVSFAGNTVSNLGPHGKTLLRRTSSATGLVASDSGIKLVYEESSQPIANYRDDFSPNTPNSGWQYLWNASGVIGNPDNYAALVSVAGGDYTTNGSPSPTPDPGAYLRFGAESGHPGRDASQGASFDRFAIAAFTVPKNGLYALRDSFVQTSLDTSGLQVLIHVNENPTLLNSTINSGSTSSIDVNLGQLIAGDTVYVAFGPGTNDAFDFFTLDFSIVKILEGDFDFDGDVDGRDFLIWQSGGSAIPLSATDLADWQANYGVESLVANNVAMPEPATALLPLLGMAVAGSNWRGRATSIR